MAEKVDYLQRLSKVAELENLNSNAILKLHKQQIIMAFSDLKREKPFLSAAELCKQLSISKSSFSRIRRDLGMRSFYRYDASDRTELTKHKDKYRRIIAGMFNKGIISRQELEEIRGQINGQNFYIVQQRIKDILELYNKPESDIEEHTVDDTEQQPANELAVKQNPRKDLSKVKDLNEVKNASKSKFRTDQTSTEFVANRAFRKNLVKAGTGKQTLDFSNIRIENSSAPDQTRRSLSQTDKVKESSDLTRFLDERNKDVDIDEIEKMMKLSDIKISNTINAK
jgi:hypothetical protein